MKKKFYTLLFALLAIVMQVQAQVVLNAENFPDANFRAALATILGISEGGTITQEKINETTELRVSYKDISNLKGIEHFTELETLNCPGNQLGALDMSNNTALKYLYCNSNELTTLDVSKNTELTLLWCDANELTTLDVSKNTELTYLGCSQNQLTTLDVSNNTKLKGLSCYINQLTTLDVSNNTALKSLSCSENQIKGTQMDALVASLPTVSSGEFTVVDTSVENEGNICTKTQVDVAKAKGWTVYYYNKDGRFEYEGGITLNAENFPDANFRAALATILGISEGGTITQEKINETTSVFVDNKNISNLKGIEHFTALESLSCSENQLTTLDVSNNTALSWLWCNANQLTTLDVSNNTALDWLWCSNNQLTTLDVSNNTALTKLWCYSNQLTTLDVSNNTKLTWLYCFDNQIKGAQMNALVASLPTVSEGVEGLFYVIDTKIANEGNVCTKTQVATAKAKGWTVYDYNNGAGVIEYEGSELILNEDNFADNNFRQALSQILGINEDDEITSEMIDAVTMLNVSNKTISNLKGIEHFTELETLYCQLNQIKDTDMDDLIAGLPTRNVTNSSPSPVAPRKASGTWGALYAYDNTAGNEGNAITTAQVADANAKGWKVYQYNGTDWQEYDGISTGITKLSNDDNIIEAWYTLDGKRLDGKPTKQGIYVVRMNNGTTKKVMVK